MKTIFFIITSSLIAASISSCNKNKVDDHLENLVTPNLLFTESQNPYTGVLAIYPCQNNGSIYFGNYSNDQLSVIYPNYVIGQGNIIMAQPALSLPTGEYNLIYWGVSKAINEAYENPAVSEPSIRIGADTKKLYYSLRKNTTDTTYMPTYDYVFNVKQNLIGSQSISVQLKRVVAAIEVVVQKANNKPLDPTISKIDIQVSNIAGQLNVYDASPSDFTKTVEFPLTIAQNRMNASNNMVTVFPSITKPNIAIMVTLQNGQQKIYRSTLKSILEAGMHIKITVDMGEIITQETTGSGFTVNGWQENSQTINTSNM